MAVLGRLLLGSAERLDLSDMLSIDSFTAADFKYLIQSFIGADKPFILKGFDVIQPQDSIGTESISIRVADSVVYYPASKAGSFYFGLEEGNVAAQPLVPELRKNATNFVYITFSTADTARDSRAFWDPDQNGGDGGEFSQDVNTESVLTAEVNVSVSTFPEDVIPICKVVVGPSVIDSIQDCRDLMFRLGTGGVSPDPFAVYNFRDDPSSSYKRSEPPTTMQSSLDPNPFQGGDKNIFTLREWMAVVMTKLKELGGTTFWYEGVGGAGPNVNNVFLDALASTLKSKGEFQHDENTPGRAIWTEDIHYYSLVDPRDLIIRASTVDLTDNDTVAYINMVRDDEINTTATPVTWENGFSYLNGPVGAFENLSKGDWIKKKVDTQDKYLRVEEFYASPVQSPPPPTPPSSTTTPALAQSVRLSDNYTGTTASDIGIYTKGEYLSTDIVVSGRDDPSIKDLGGNFFWLAYRSDTILGLESITPTQLSVDIEEADGIRAKCTSVGHDLEDGDRVTITTGGYAGTYKVEVEDANTFFIQTAVTGDELAQDAFYAIVETRARSTAYGYDLESAEHGFQSDQTVQISGTNSAYDGSYLINVRSATTFQIPYDALTPDPGQLDGEIVRLVRLNVRTEFGTVKVVQGETTNIGDLDSANILSFIGMTSLAQTKPFYSVPDGYNAINGYHNYNSQNDDDLTLRVSRLTAMMADRVQDRGLLFYGRVNITNVTNGANQDISANGSLTIHKPARTAQSIDLTCSLPANSVAVAVIDRDGSSNISLSVESIASPTLLEENKLIMFYRFASSTVYTWRGEALEPSGHINTDYPEDSQNRNIAVFNPGHVKLDPPSGLLDLIVSESKEQTRITVTDGATVPQSSYFTFNSALDATEYYVWYDVDSGGTDPAISGKTGIQVSISSLDTADDVANATALAISGIAGGDVTAIDTGDQVMITNLLVGETTDALDGATQTFFDIDILCNGNDPDIEIMIPGSTHRNIIDVDVINGLGTLIMADGTCAWVRVNRFGSKTFNTILTSDIPDTDVNGAIYITNMEDVPFDQDVFVLWSRVGDTVVESHRAQHPDGNVYFEYVDIVPGIPANQYEIQGPLSANTEIQIPLDSRDNDNIQEYIVGSGQLEVYLNGQLLRAGIDYDEVGIVGCLSSRIKLIQPVVVGDALFFRIDAHGAVYFASDGAAPTSLQDAYNAGRFINVTVGQPIVITGASGKLISIQGDMDVTGVIDPKGMTFDKQAASPLDPLAVGIWANLSDELIFDRGAASPINLVTDFLRRDGTFEMLADLNMDGNKILNLGAPADPTDAVNKNYVDVNFLKLDGTNPMEAALNMDSFKILNLGAPTAPTDAVNKNYADTTFLKLDGTNPMEAALDMGGFRIENVGAPVSGTDAARKDDLDNLQGYVDTNFLKLDGTNPMEAAINMNSFKIINLADPVNAQDGATKQYVDLFLKRDGSSAMTADLNFGTNRGINLVDPTDPTDAATKQYVDDPTRYRAVYKALTNNTGGTLTAGTIVIASQSTAQEIEAADASNLSTCEGVIGIVVEDILNTETGQIQVAGEATVKTAATLDLGKRAYVSTIAGEATSTPPSSTGTVIHVIGIATDVDKIIINPQLVYVNE